MPKVPDGHPVAPPKITKLPREFSDDPITRGVANIRDETSKSAPRRSSKDNKAAWAKLKS
jgi:hypothetical protein